MVKKPYIRTVSKLATIIDSSDACRRHHCYKVERYSILICRKLKLPSAEIKTVKIAAMLHDIGKIGIDLTIIKKPAKLTEAEWKQVRMHPEIGANIMKQLGFLDGVIPIIEHHHARFEGGGYPDPDIKGDNIPIGSRIISVADAFDAMTSERPYRRALTVDEARAELSRCSGMQFDPRVVKTFLSELA